MTEPTIDLNRYYRYPATRMAMDRLLAATEDIVLGADFASESGMNPKEQRDLAAAVVQLVIPAGYEIDRHLDLHLEARLQVTDTQAQMADEEPPARFSSGGLAQMGFRGFRTFAELQAGALQEVPQTAGVYVVLRESEEPVVFLPESAGGHFKGKNPTVDVAILEQRWIHSAPVLYIGKSGDLRRRLREFADFGAGRPVGHWGGRYVWQIDGSAELHVAWLETPSDEPAAVEMRLLAEFREIYGRPPFANIA